MRHYRFGQGKWVFLDWMGIEPGYGTAWGGAITDGYCMPEGVRLAVHRPAIDPTPVLVRDPGAAHEAYGIGDAHFLADGGVLRCWYVAMAPHDSKWKLQLRLAYAESDDGVTWRKPRLNLREFAGSTANNLVDAINGRVFIDPSAEPAQRYKLVGPGGKLGVLGACSGDGLSFTTLPQPILPGNNSDTDNTCWYNPDTGAYALYTRQTDGLMQRRGLNRSESPDFSAFPPSVPVIESSPLDRPDMDLYNNGFMAWPGANDAFVALNSVFHHRDDTLDVRLATSRDERLWHRPLRDEAWVHGQDFQPRLNSVYCCGKVLATRPGEWSVYFAVRPMGHNEVMGRIEDLDGWIIRGSMRQDGFMSLTADGHGQCWTVPFTWSADELRLNYRTRYGGYVKCEIIQTPVVGGTGHSVTVGAAAPGYSLHDCDALCGDAIDQPLTWGGRADLSSFRGQDVRLRLSLFKADVFALTFHRR